MEREDDDYVPERDGERRRWHFDKRLSMDTVVAVIGLTVVLGGPLMYWGRVMEQRVLQLETINIEQGKVALAREQLTRDQQSGVGSRLERMERTLTEVQIAVGKLEAATLRGK